MWFFYSITTARKLSYNGRDLSSIPLDISNDTTDLTFTRNSITNISNGAFVSLTELSKLTITYGKLEYVEDGSFNGLDKLETLNLDGNLLDEMPMLNFNNSNLVTLSVAGNRITSISKLSTRLSRCDSLRVLEISDNRLTGELDLPPLPNLEGLKASKNQITSLKQNILYGFPKLFTLDLEFNQITALDFDIPRFIKNMKLTENVIIKISAGVFQNLGTSKDLDLSRNQIKKIEDGAFEGMNRLNTLNLEINQLSYIPNMVDIADTLSTLNLARNSYNMSALWDLIQFDALKKLLLSSCGLNGSLRLPPLPNLKELNMAGNHLTGIETGDLLKFTKLHILNLGSNDLKIFDVPTGFPVSLRKLVLGGNEFENIPADAFGSLTSPSQLSDLDLNRNNIRYIDEGAFNGLSLSKLNIYGNRLTTVPNLTSSSNSLTELNIGSNPLYSLDKTRLLGLNHLKVLAAKQARLNGTLDLPILPALRRLELEDNALSDISTNAFHGFHALREVNLRKNHFVSLPNFATSPAKDAQVAIPVEVLFNFKNNKLTTLKEDWFLYMKNSSTFDVTSNKITCDSGLCWMGNCGRRRTFPYELVMPNCRGVAWDKVDILELCPGK